MIEIAVSTTDPRTGQAVPVPAEVVRLIERENQTLRRQLKYVQDLPIRAVWQRFEDHGERGWSVDLHLEYEGYGFGKQILVNTLRDPDQARDEIRQVVWDFGITISKGAGVKLDRLRAEIQRLVNTPVE
ncbi:MAG: hypothetical protein K2P78_01905 [Gemmataceae bacterium]|nr:hypothetical protein [Gemmataceae bacterium]